MAGSIALFPFLGSEFVPILNEGTMAPLTIRLPSISLEQSIKIEREVQKAVLEFPEVQMMVSKIGRTELANDPQEPNESDSVAVLHPIETWTTASTMAGLKERVRERLALVPGANFLISQPIQQRVDELISGVRAEVTVKLFGPRPGGAASHGESRSPRSRHDSGRQRFEGRATLRPAVHHDRYRSG